MAYSILEFLVLESNRQAVEQLPPTCNLVACIGLQGTLTCVLSAVSTGDTSALRHCLSGGLGEVGFPSLFIYGDLLTCPLTLTGTCNCLDMLLRGLYCTCEQLSTSSWYLRCCGRRGRRGNLSLSDIYSFVWDEKYLCAAAAYSTSIPIWYLGLEDRWDRCSKGWPNCCQVLLGSGFLDGICSSVLIWSDQEVVSGIFVGCYYDLWLQCASAWTLDDLITSRRNDMKESIDISFWPKNL